MKLVRWWILIGLAVIILGCDTSLGGSPTGVKLMATVEPSTSPTQLPSLTPTVQETPPPSEPPLPALLEGSHTGVERLATQSSCRAFGWLTDRNRPESDVAVRVLVDGIEVAQTVADRYRPDLDALGRCSGGTCAFEVDLWNLVAYNREVTVLVQGLDSSTQQWVDILGSPKKLTCARETIAGLESGEFKSVTDSSGRVLFQVGSNTLILEFLDDDLVHFEYSGAGVPADVSMPIHTSPMISKTDYSGPTALTTDGQGTFETPDLQVQIDPATFCLTATDKTRRPALVLTTLCPRALGRSGQGISLTPETFTHVYGLGQEFITPGQADGDWTGRVRTGGPLGNVMSGWSGGAVGNTQFPVLYVLGPGLDNYALFADHVYREKWDFTNQPWSAELGGEWMRFYLMTGPDLQDLRQDYLELVGRPPVPPKKMFGLWISEYGFDDWAELESKLDSLRNNQFPVDGFVLDLQWYGGIRTNSNNTRMGSLRWDTRNFPNPAEKIAVLRETQGIGIMLIEEPYIGYDLPEFAELQRRGYLARDCETCAATYLSANPWWGKGGLMDWSNQEGADFWHDWRREPLIAAGVIGHWTDLGEPEAYNSNAWYVGIPGDYQPLHAHADVHNLYNLLWSESIFEGYARNNHAQRPFILSRSGAPGSQRYGVAMWSGDIGSNLTSLATHLNAQLHMSLSGMDYYGADIGGFHRESLDGDLYEMYTRWFASGMALDIPGRTHTANTCDCYETAPDRVGDLQSNLGNVRLRYQLSPYLYSLSHRAYLYGEPVFPPLVYAYQQDPNVREMGSEKMIGRDLLVAVSTTYGEKELKVYLPAGTWINYHTNEIIYSSGGWYGPFPLYINGEYRLPLFARAGAMIPQMYVDGKTMNISGLRSDGSTRDELIVRVYAGEAASDFTLYEDDGETMAYQEGEIRTTRLSQQSTSQGVTVQVDAASGSYRGVPASRDTHIRLVLAHADEIQRVSLNGSELAQFRSFDTYEAAQSGWYRVNATLVLVKSGTMTVDIGKTFQFFR
jgi:alpha-glucosidase (family GH31 glycosyl hydrolase)